MGKSKIEWTEQAWNPVTGCTKVSEGCKNCYAKTMHKRLTAMGIKKYKKPFNKIVCHPETLEEPFKWKKPSMIFVNSMADLFHEDVPYDFIAKVLETMEQAGQHTYQILTKRPERALDFWKWFNEYMQSVVESFLDNEWMGVSVENQKTADERIPVLLQIPAKIRWISVEPMLENVDLSGWLFFDDEGNEIESQINWVVIGAESGANRRECKLKWIESIVEQCKSANVPVFVKQIHLNGKLEKDINKFPKHLQIREYPND